MRFFLALILILCTKLYSMSDVAQLISEASAHNTYFLYEDAIKFLNEAIKRDPYQKEAYKERAFSYFELNHLELALEDYKRIIYPKFSYKRCAPNYSFAPHSLTFKNTAPFLNFAEGLIYGAMLGSREGSIEFVSSIRGGLTFLWAFACSPFDVSKELIQALYDIGNFLASGRVDILLQEALPELFECREYWDTWPDYIKGQKLGFIIGKYSILVFYYLATPNVGIHFFNNLKRANIMAILERYSVTKSSHILEASAKYAQKNTAILKKAAAGSIVAHNPNVLPHIFTKKHRWDKFIKLTGNSEKDFEKLVSFLETQQILKCERAIDWAHNGVVTYKYTKEVGEDSIIAIFEINKEGLPLLRNAWVEVGVPYSP